MILKGSIVRDKGALRLSRAIKIAASGAPKKLPPPHLVIIQIGNNSDSNVYINQKKIFGEKIGAKVSLINLPVKISQKEAVAAARRESRKKNVHGVIVQLPLPEHLDSQKIIDAISPEKDVDGLTSGGSLFIPATARAVAALLDFYKFKIKGKNVAVIGRSRLVGKPAALFLEKRGAKVTVCHSQTKNIPAITKKADIVVVAVGRAEFFGKKYFAGVGEALYKKQIVIDVGITATMKKGKRTILGDVPTSKVEPIVAAISPVPGGVGPMTVLCLFENLFEAWEKCYNR